MITIHNLRNEKPHHPQDVRVDRSSSVLGNPFFMIDESHREEVCDKYDDWFEQATENPLSVDIQTELKRLSNLYKEYGQLRLFCWCAPKRCHAETIRHWILVDNLHTIPEEEQ